MRLYCYNYWHNTNNECIKKIPRCINGLNAVQHYIVTA
jgi:hypothetical protein